MNDRLYRVTGTVKKGRMTDYAIHVWAPNAKEAKERALSGWKVDAHLFWLKAVLWKGYNSLHLESWHKIGESSPNGWIDYPDLP